MKSKSELYQLRADIIRGRVLSSEEVLELVEDLHVIASEEWIPADTPCSDCDAAAEQQEDAEREVERLEERIDDLVDALRIIASGRLKTGDIADYAEQAIDGPPKAKAKVFELMEARPR